MELTKKDTKLSCIISCVVILIALITFIMLSALVNFTDSARVLFSFIYTVALLLILLIWDGAIKIKVFKDYKYINKDLCADGIINIFVGLLLTISVTLYLLLRQNKILIFIIAFIAVLLVWKIITSVLSAINKRFNCIIDILLSVSWFVLEMMCIITYIYSYKTVNWAIVVTGWVIVALTVLYNLISYIIKEPKYLETADTFAKAETNEDKVDEQLTLTDKIDRLQKLKDLGYISQINFEERKKELVDKYIQEVK